MFSTIIYRVDVLYEKTMEILKEKSIKDFIQIHVIFAVIAAITWIFPFQVAISGKLLLLVIIYNALIVAKFYSKGYEEWKSIWVFSIMLSFLMVFPDWYLVETLGAIQFPDDGFPMIGGAVPLYMVGLWSISFFIILFIGKEVQKRKSLEMTYGIVLMLSVPVSVLSELSLVNIPLWSVTVTGMTYNLAWYLIIPLLLGGLSAFISYEFVREKKIGWKIIGAFAVMIFYLGNASFFYLLIETLLL